MYPYLQSSQEGPDLSIPDGRIYPSGPSATSRADISGRYECSNIDTDNDGWLDVCNVRKTLYLDRIAITQVHNNKDSLLLYMVSDDVRFPYRKGINSGWRIRKSMVMELDLAVASRVLGADRSVALAPVLFELWKPKWSVLSDWHKDRFLSNFGIDLNMLADQSVVAVEKELDGFTVRFDFHVEVQLFPDPSVSAPNADADSDGISDRAEAQVNAELGGICDPYRREILVQVDWMRGHPLRVAGRRQIVTQYYRHGYRAFIILGNEVPADSCLDGLELLELYKTNFKWQGLKAFRYVVLTKKIWNDRSGVSLANTMLIDDSSWWMDGRIRPQATTVFHELGHSLGLSNRTYRGIDKYWWPTYRSAMNYFFQAFLLNYSEAKASNKWNNNDWAMVDPRVGLKYELTQYSGMDKRICK